MDFLVSIDRELFTLLNSRLAFPILDIFMIFITEKANLLIVLAAVGWIAFSFRDKRAWLALLFLALVVAASDGSSSFFKDVFERLRPCHSIDGARSLAGCGKAYSFPSGHATNIFGAMVFLSLRYKRYFPAFLAVAFIVGYSRIYVGAHYPSDVIGGAVLGSLIALLFHEAGRRLIEPRFIKERV